MTIWTIPELANYWYDAGGSKFTVVYAVAVCLAESGGNDQAISRSGDYGLWQINTVHFNGTTITAQSMLRPDANAYEAVALSGGGANWAPWCTAWVDPATNCGHGTLPVPQPGSLAWSHINYVSSVLSLTVGVAGPAQDGSDLNLGGGAWAQLQNALGPWAQNRHTHLTSLNQLIGRLLR